MSTAVLPFKAHIQHAVAPEVRAVAYLQATTGSCRARFTLSSTYSFVSKTCIARDVAQGDEFGVPHGAHLLHAVTTTTTTTTARCVRGALGGDYVPQSHDGDESASVCAAASSWCAIACPCPRTRGSLASPCVVLLASRGWSKAQVGAEGEDKTQTQTVR